MIIQHYNYKKAEKELIRRKAQFWAQEFHKARKLADDENWSQDDWSRWHSSIDYSISIIIR